MKKIYTAPEMDITLIEKANIISTSPSIIPEGSASPDPDATLSKGRGDDNQGLDFFDIVF